ncbi:autotransporter domain-containing protein [Pseudomonas sp. NFX224]|uniref:autotransporter family protein n=1 Tax=Pseudomonas sp. NFX224 TaxID=3402862 RepID=UPI003AFAF10A
MPVQHRFRPKQLALAITLAVGCAQFAQAQEPPAQVPTPEELIGLLDQFASDPATHKTPVTTKAYTDLFDDRDDLITVTGRGSFAGPLDGAGGINVLQLDAAKGTLGETRNIDGLEVMRGKWTLSKEGLGGFEKGVMVRPKANLTNEGYIWGHAIVQGALLNRGAIGGEAVVMAGGDLINPGIIGGSVTVNENGHFAGRGATGTLNMLGRLTVDHAHGAPHINGDLNLSRSATLAYEVDAAGASETILVSGTANLGDATLKLVTAGDYPQSSKHTLLKAEKVEGRFGAIEHDLAFMTPTLDFNAQDVSLTYARNEVPIENAATTESAREIAKKIDQTPNAAPSAVASPKTASGVASGVAVSAVSTVTSSPTAPTQRTESSPPTSKALVALLGSNRNTAALALEQLAAGSNANLAKATLSAVSPVNDSMRLAMRQLDSGKTSSNASDANGRIWIQVLGDGGKIDRDTDSTLKHATEGLVAGADWRLDEQWHVGLIGGKSQTTLDARHSDGDLDSWHVGAYAVRQDGPLALRFGATYASHDGSSKRRVAFNGFNDRLKGHYDASTQQAFVEAGYNFGQGGVTLEPFANLGYQRYQRDGYSEKGGDAALKVHGQSQNNLISTFGLRVAKTNTLGNGMQLTPRLSAGWKHTYGELDLHTRQQLLNGGITFEIAGAPLDRNSLTLDAGLDLALSTNHTLGMGVTGEVATDSRNAGVMGQWRMAF